MRSEGEELVRVFLRRWSTTDLTEDARILLKEDVKNVKALLKVYGEEDLLPEQAEFPRDREWFAEELRRRA